jgi:hypothetical protein
VVKLGTAPPRQFVMMLIGAWGASRSAWASSDSRPRASGDRAPRDVAPRPDASVGHHGIGILYRFRCTVPCEKEYTSAVGPGATS